MVEKLKTLTFYLALICIILAVPAQSSADSASDKKLVDSFKKALLQLQDKAKPKVNRASLSAGYSKMNARHTDVSSRSASISLSRQMTPRDTVYGFGFGSVTETISSRNEFDGKSFGMGLGYNKVLDNGVSVGGSLSYAHSHSDGLNFILSQKISETKTNSYSASLNVSKPFQLDDGYMLTPSLGVRQAISPNSTTIFAPKLNLTKQFSEVWSGSASVGLGVSNKLITLSKRKGYAEFGLGAGYKLKNNVLVQAGYKRQESTAAFHSDSLSLSTSLPF